MIVFIINLIMLKKNIGNYAGITWSCDYRIMPKIMLA